MDLFKDLVWDTLIKAAIQRLFVALPFLGWGPIGWFVTFIITKFTDEFYAEVQMWVNIELIEFRNQEFQKSWTVANIKLKLIARDGGIDSEEFKNEREIHKQELSNLVRFNPARAA